MHGELLNGLVGRLAVFGEGNVSGAEAGSEADAEPLADQDAVLEFKYQGAFGAGGGIVDDVAAEEVGVVGVEV